MSCRICFESEGPLYTPCRCDGSIKYIHQECLLKWILASSDRSACELCKETYTLDYNQPLEKEAALGPLRHYFLVNPSWHIAAFCSFIIIVQQHFQLQPTKSLFVAIQLTYHTIYLALAYMYCRTTLQQWSRYSYELTRGYGQSVFLIHGVLLTALLTLSFLSTVTSIVLLCVINQCFLGVYPILHCTIIHEINKNRMIIIKNRDSK
jgi:hypothetical protein